MNRESAAQHEYLSKLNIAWLEKNFNAAATTKLKTLSQLGYCGLAAFKMNSDLSEASGLMLKQDTFGHGVQMRAHLLTELLKDHPVQPVAQIVQKAVMTARKKLNLLRHPIRAYGIEIKENGRQEMKIYLQTNLKDEFVQGNDFVFDATNEHDEKELIATVCDELDIDQKVKSTSLAMIQSAHQFGFGLDMLGIDLSSSGFVEIKPYLAPPEGVAGPNAVHPDAINVIKMVCNTLEYDNLFPIFEKFTAGIAKIAPDIPINLIAAEPAADGNHKVRIYFDLWKRENSLKNHDHTISVPIETIKDVFQVAKDTAGCHIPEEAIQNFVENCNAGEMVLDTFSLEYSEKKFKMKVYVRPKDMIDHGLRWKAEN